MVLFATVRLPPLDTPPPVLPDIALFSIVRAARKLLFIPRPVLPEMMLFLMLRVPSFDKPPKEDPPLRVNPSIVKFPGMAGGGKLPLTRMRPKAGAFPSRVMVAPLPSIVIWVVITGRPAGVPENVPKGVV